MSTAHPLAILMPARLKGRVQVDQLAKLVGLPASEVKSELKDAVLEGWLVDKNGTYRVTPAGRAHLAALLDRERTGLDAARLEALYEEFDLFNSSLKQIVTAWQIKPDGEANDHTDAGYDAAVTKNLADLHTRVTPWLERVGAEVPRLSRYGERFTAAIHAVESGDLTFIAKPIADSYHTVWFELHEELILLLDLDRADEAAAGRAI